MLPASLYAYVWRTTRGDQTRICLLTLIFAPLTMIPLELQRRVVDIAVNGLNIHLPALLGAVYLAVLLMQDGLKYVFNIARGASRKRTP